MKRYLEDIEHDNYYVDAYFRRIEVRRRERGLRYLMPLKRLERRELLEQTSARLLAHEKRQAGAAFARIVLSGAIFGVIFLFDVTLYEMLELIARHAQVDFEQKGW